MSNAGITKKQVAHPKNGSHTFAVEEIARLIGAEVRGDGSRKLSRLQPLESAEESDLSFFAPTGPRMEREFRALAQQSKASALIVRRHDPAIQTTQLIHSNPLQAVMQLASVLYQVPEANPGTHPQACVDPSARIGANVSIGAFAVIGRNVEIGDSTIVHPHVVIYPEARIGKNCVIHSGAAIREYVVLGSDCVIQNGAVVGGDGFGYHPRPGQHPLRIPQIGSVVFEDGVDIGANSTVDRATLGETKVGAGTKIDNLVMVGHNVKIGQRGFLCAQVGISGSSKIGDDVTLAGQTGMADHITVGDRVRAAARTGIIQDVESDSEIAGHPAQKRSDWIRSASLLARLPGILRELRRGASTGRGKSVGLQELEESDN